MAQVTNDADIIEICHEPLDIAKLSSLVSTPSAGAISTFTGITRDNFEGKKVLRLEYDAYIPMAMSELKTICATIRNKWAVKKIAIFHRIGLVPVEEASVIIAISSAHRADSLAAVQFCIDTLKAKVPIWKKEIYEDGSTWKENRECSWSQSK
ncbi:Molybdopterin synthase catalytic subunit [Trichoplax sp. H2]|uniref:Molybdopterin synthase catalytic subunit n=1 Tax=Trichoplax adhaerens TaxID=10228 RepID=B3RRC7_TRIAD|nr:hypothetical protein TRIADDRAFT_23075 [Trichoplax adhaerens]EDV26320.1 hypothetical protein TRIADDRAFT_23075 [Trichoplax adhaerens]RDD45188.1 Molybdopterin synthase catalytic subunit [Trichoplax sp. H2]|eukprot:XP_002110316.1 hypothetical protein TRIADDRAFT_23075 [Trichoplax adhaerens]